MKKHRKHREIFSALSSATRDLLFPPRCVGCDDLLPPFAKRVTVFCPLCHAAWETATSEATTDAATDGEQGLIYLVHYRSGHGDGVPEKLIYHLKHRGDPRAFAFVAERLIPRLLQTPAIATLETGEGDKPLLLTYPPRNRSAVNLDGFDQAERLAKAMARVCGGEFASLIKRTHRRTAEQKTLNSSERATNAATAYRLAERASEIVRGRTVVICDDLCTTGATLNRCAELLVDAGAKSVIRCTVAKTAEVRKKHT